MRESCVNWANWVANLGGILFYGSGSFAAKERQTKREKGKGKGKRKRKRSDKHKPLRRLCWLLAGLWQKLATTLFVFHLCGFFFFQQLFFSLFANNFHQRERKGAQEEGKKQEKKKEKEKKGCSFEASCQLWSATSLRATARLFCPKAVQKWAPLFPFFPFGPHLKTCDWRLSLRQQLGVFFSSSCGHTSIGQPQSSALSPQLPALSSGQWFLWAPFAHCSRTVRALTLLAPLKRPHTFHSALVAGAQLASSRSRGATFKFAAHQRETEREQLPARQCGARTRSRSGAHAVEVGARL